MRSSKLITAAIRARSVSDKIDLGVRFKTAIKSVRFLGVYLGGLIDFVVGAGVLRVRNLSNLGSSQLTNFCKMLLNMIIYIISLAK